MLGRTEADSVETMVKPEGVDTEEELSPFELYAFHYAAHSGRRESDKFLECRMKPDRFVSCWQELSL